MSILPMAGPPKSPLARYRLLAPSAAVRVSPLCLGTMNFGTRWGHHMGECDRTTTEAILDYYYDQGGNFIDTSSNYQFGESEEWVGDWMKKRENRNQVVLATKYSTNFRSGNASDGEILANFGGNGAKGLFLSVYNSLEKLQTDYIDIVSLISESWMREGDSITVLTLSLALCPLVGLHGQCARGHAVSQPPDQPG
jgi:aryl-alcohol dehydrogenase-like predicted oxidoreductase